ncbi:conserved hypothetical protein [Coccidioides posadasii str. Silveira]|uniref:Uncharacterized protein n=2 Tax=Coccidioides posadasii TaxID=199306 RepID=E9DDA0_COCPS|nr:conserved hypothetical protein [Coccidioides posadasii str. Silveira]KMM65683.1 hypothetical protein CPAG_02029 [Coccidioides posadasii RMSCC 3488]
MPFLTDGLGSGTISTSPVRPHAKPSSASPAHLQNSGPTEIGWNRAASASCVSRLSKERRNKDSPKPGSEWNFQRADTGLTPQNSIRGLWAMCWIIGGGDMLTSLHVSSFRPLGMKWESMSMIG